jgi:hypothetical protein
VAENLSTIINILRHIACYWHMEGLKPRGKFFPRETVPFAKVPDTPSDMGLNACFHTVTAAR